MATARPAPGERTSLHVFGYRQFSSAANSFKKCWLSLVGQYLYSHFVSGRLIRFHIGYSPLKITGKLTVAAAFRQTLVLL